MEITVSVLDGLFSAFNGIFSDFCLTQETFEKNFERETHKISEQNDADNVSVMSISSNFEPFATDDLGKQSFLNNLAYDFKMISWQSLNC